MKYLSFDLEATGLAENDLIIEFGMVPFDTENGQLESSLEFHTFVKCPSFEDLKPRLDQWVIEHNEGLINTAHSTGIEMSVFKDKLIEYFESEKVKNYFEVSDRNKITLFGKSMNAIDLPFMNRDLSWLFMRKYFDHRVLDLSSVAYSMVDLNHIPQECVSGSGLMKYFNMGEVAHTALEDAKNTAILYLKLLDKFKNS